LDIIDSSRGKDYIIGTYGSVSGVSGDVAKHDERLIFGYRNCFDDYKKIRSRLKSHEFNSKEVLDSTKVLSIVRKGVYLNYMDVSNGKL
jgi:hypothetical protein